MPTRLQRLDRYQQEHPWLALPVAVIRKYVDDQGGNLAALVAYFAFVSVFPLLLVSVAILGFVLQGNESLQHEIVNSTLSKLPGIGDQLHANPASLRGSGIALAIGILTAVWAGMGITQATQSAFNRVWGVPFKDRPDFVTQRLRGIAVLSVLSLIALASFGLTGLVTAAVPGALTRVGGYLVGVVVNVALYLVAFRLLTACRPSWRVNLPGAVFAALFWQLLQVAGATYTKHVIDKDQRAYGIFGLVLGMLALLYLGAQATVIAAEINVVHSRRLWPRSITTTPATPADRAALRQSAEIEERIVEECVEVSFAPKQAGPDGH
jgi:inner membrane protein YhjD